MKKIEAAPPGAGNWNVRSALSRLMARQRQRAARNEQFAQFQATLDLGAVMARDPSGIIQYWSAGCERLYGWTAEEAVGRKSHDLFETVFPVSLQATEAVLNKEGEWQGQLRHRTRNGKEIFVAARMVLRRSQDGRPTSVMESVTDLGPIRRAEAALAVSEARFRAAANVMPGFLFIIGPDGDIHYVNAEMIAYSGRSEAALLGREWINLIHQSDRDTAISDWKSGNALVFYQTECRFSRHDGQWRWHQMRARLLGDPERDSGHWVVTCVDIHDRKLLEDELRQINEHLEQRVLARTAELQDTNSALERMARHLARAKDAAEQANNSKSRFLAAMSHELRTPLNGILGYAQLLRRGQNLTEEQARQVGAMLQAGNHLLGMINRVLSFSEIEADSITIKQERLDITELAQSCLEMVDVTAREKRLATSLVLGGRIPKYITSDGSRLRQVLLNLLGNAVKYTAAGEITLRIDCDDHRAILRFAVEDTGMGVPPEKQHLLFQDFERLTHHTDSVEGAGLGLALSARLGKLLGGELGYSASATGGSMFWLELPISEASTTPAATPRSDERKTSEDNAPLRLLVVDDTEMNREIATAFLEAAGHDVVSVDGGQKAIDIIQAQTFDIVLMDVRMPDMDGMEATRRIRKLAHPVGDIPVLAVTAQVFADQISECRHAGMDHHLAKPFTPESLAEALATVASMRSAAKANQKSAGPESDGLTEAHNFDQDIFDSSAKCLSPEQVRSYLATIAARSRAILEKLDAPGAGQLAADAHALAGSAGMFGFSRLANAGRLYEHAEDIPASRPAAAKSLGAAIRDALERLDYLTGA